MAKLRNIDKIFTLDDGERVTIGHNRTVECVSTGKRFDCFLHGHAIAKVVTRADGKASIWLNDCGYRTATTRQAMQDFAKAFGVRLGVSFAKGGFSIRWKHGTSWHDRDAKGGRVNFVADRYPA